MTLEKHIEQTIKEKFSEEQRNRANFAFIKDKFYRDVSYEADYDFQNSKGIVGLISYSETLLLPPLVEDKIYTDNLQFVCLTTTDGKVLLDNKEFSNKDRKTYAKLHIHKNDILMLTYKEDNLIGAVHYRYNEETKSLDTINEFSIGDESCISQLYYPTPDKPIFIFYSDESSYVYSLTDGKKITPEVDSICFSYKDDDLYIRLEHVLRDNYGHTDHLIFFMDPRDGKICNKAYDTFFQKVRTFPDDEDYDSIKGYYSILGQAADELDKLIVPQEIAEDNIFQEFAAKQNQKKKTLEPNLKPFYVPKQNNK